jgi:hypothetical protein
MKSKTGPKSQLDDPSGCDGIAGDGLRFRVLYVANISKAEEVRDQIVEAAFVSLDERRVSFAYIQ